MISHYCIARNFRRLKFSINPEFLYGHKITVHFVQNYCTKLLCCTVITTPVTSTSPILSTNDGESPLVQCNLYDLHFGMLWMQNVIIFAVRVTVATSITLVTSLVSPGSYIHSTMEGELLTTYPLITTLLPLLLSSHYVV